jgi:ketosteroid isomerase-like protein
MKTVLLSGVLALIFSMTHCQQEQADVQTADEANQIEETLHAELETFFDAAEELNPDAMSEYLDEDIHFAANGNVRMGKDAAVDAFEASFRNVGSQQLTIEASHVNVLTMDYALQTVQGLFIPTNADGVEESRYRFAITIA